jgi:CoA:oxalate CoA-transferase
LHGLVAVLAALRLRDQTGAGQFIDMAMLDAMLATDDYAHHYVDESPVGRLGGLLWQTTSGFVMTAGDLRHTWRLVAGAHGLRDGLPGDATLAEKVEARRRVLIDWFKAYRDTASLHDGLRKAELIATDVLTPQQVWQGDDVTRRRMIAEVDGRDGAPRRVVQSPYRFSAATSGVRGPAPFRGEHNAEVLVEWSAARRDEIDSLMAAGVLLSD